MSHQHFYSRVPARVSIFNRRDGFDTFAHSSELDKEFILGELSLLYSDKLEIHSPLRLRREEIPCVYSQALLPSGRIAQTSITYLPKDFTGERSAYLAHTLVLTEEEREALFESNSYQFFNPDLFVGDVSAFNLTARDAMGNPFIPEMTYLSRPLSEGSKVLSKYSPEMIKSFIFSVLNSIVGDGRAVYFRLPYDDDSVSKEALGFITAIMSVLPYSLRQRLSFVSFISDLDSYPEFKLKCVSSDCGKIAPEKGVFYDFSTGEISGQPAEYQQYQAFSSFLYSLGQYKKIRDEFHTFVDSIEKTYSDTEFDIKGLSDLIFMFWQVSGYYVEESVIVNDESICNFLDIYAKFREGLIESHRVQAYRPLARYSKEQIAIPDGVYTRLSRLYPTECVPAKAVALDVVLGLMHTDVMRERLFSFISRYYAGEIDEVKDVINSNLCRVFYGGFLQHRILGHFDMYFEREPVQIRDMIVDKLLLSIRTPEIQRRIVAFFDRHYKSLTPTQKLKFCTTCLEMIPECDDLSVMLVGMVNRRIATDGADLAELVRVNLTRALDVSLRAEDFRLLAIFIDNPGLCEDLAMAHILVKDVGVDAFIDLLAKMPAHKRITKLIRVVRAVPSLKEGDYAELLYSFRDIQVAILPSTMYDIIQADRLAGISLLGNHAELLRENIIYPAVQSTFFDAFKLKLGNDGLNTCLSYAEGKPALTESTQYRVILNYIRMIELCRAGDTEEAFKIAVTLPDSEETREDIAGHFRACHTDTDDDKAECTYKLLLNYLSDGNFAFDEVYLDYQNYYEDCYRDEGSIRSMVEPSDRRGAAEAAKLIISCAADICEASSELADIVIDSASGLKRALSEFVSVYGLGAAIFFKKYASECYYGIGDITDELIEERNSSINSVEDAVNFVLRRK